MASWVHVCHPLSASICIARHHDEREFWKFRVFLRLSGQPGAFDSGINYFISSSNIQHTEHYGAVLQKSHIESSQLRRADTTKMDRSSLPGNAARKQFRGREAQNRRSSALSNAACYKIRQKLS